MSILNYLHIFIVCIAPSVFFLIYFISKDWREPEPPSYIIYSFSGGMLSAACALLIFEGLEKIPLYENLEYIPFLPEEIQFAYCMSIIGPIEEMAKFMALYITVFKEKEFDTPIDAILYSASVSLGFATIENWYYMMQTKEILLARAITLPFNHVLFSSFFGYGCGKAMIEKNQNFFIIMGIVLSAIYHGIYDFILFNELLGDYLILPMILILWLWLTSAVKEFDEFEEKKKKWLMK